MTKTVIAMLLPLITLASFFTVPFSHGLTHQQQELSLQYHGGLLLTSPINIYLTWYGSFSLDHKATIYEFLGSFGAKNLHQQPTVSKWWTTIQKYKDSAGEPASSAVRIAIRTFDVNYSLGRTLTRASLATLVKTSIAKKTFPFDPTGVYLVLTASDVAVDKFCMSSCGFHDAILVSPGKWAILAHIGDPWAQCPGLCAWPFATPAYGPNGPPLVSPNGLGADGMIMNMAAVIAGAATNPRGDGYYQGDRLAPLEAATACSGAFGDGAYPGYPGKLIVDRRTNASFNAYGAGGRNFLLPAIWDPVTGECKTIS
ncbi:protein PHOSPHATE-INDUCED 1-like [Typha angustifolia]|uniref:protein PHOSPHATE-INDUCED 1-like n=1 Tax=Typha angustifolia TaxID=59011 RepID=UPI003C2BA3D4